MTECTQERFGFTAHFSRRVEAGFTAGQVSSDGGGLLLREVDRKIKLVERVAACFTDGRSAERIEHTLAGKSTLNRLELSGRSQRYHKIGYSPEAIDKLLVDLYLESHAQAPEQIVLDLDATDIPLYGCQPERFFHGYYGGYCYLPLYIFSGDQLLCARLRPANRDAAAGAVQEVDRIVGQVRQSWPKVNIVLRADSGFCRVELMAWCEKQGVDYVFGLARNARLRSLIDEAMAEAGKLHESTGKAARVFSGFAYSTLTSWSRSRRVVAKSEYLD